MAQKLIYDRHMPNTTSNIRIVLVETAGARNLGSVARVMKNFGLAELWLVNPICDRFSDEAQHMAVHAPEILENARIVDTLPAALVGCHRAIATAFRSHLLPRRRTHAILILRSGAEDRTQDADERVDGGRAQGGDRAVDIVEEKIIVNVFGCGRRRRDHHEEGLRAASSVVVV